MNTQKYNGWTNYETWNYVLWLDNDQGTQEYWAEQAQDCMRAARMFPIEGFAEAFQRANLFVFTTKEKAAFRLEEQLKDDAENFVEKRMKDQSNWLSDAVYAYLDEVNWYEIAEHLLSDVEEDEVFN